MRVLLSAGVSERDAPCGHQCRAEPLVLFEQRLESPSEQLLVLLALAVDGLSAPPNDLVGLPGGGALLFRIAALHRADLPLLVTVLLRERLQEALHAAAHQPVETEAVAAHVAERVGGIQPVKADVQRFVYRVIAVYGLIAISFIALMFFHFFLKVFVHFIYDYIERQVTK